MTTVGVIRGKFGSTEYYLGVISAGTLIDTVGYASEIPEWKNLSIEERMQRELDEGRVISEIVPYLQEDPDRFFGSILVDIYRGWESLKFEPLSEVGKIPQAYIDKVERFGFLHLPEERRIIALDGQHRLKALQMAIRGNEKADIEPKPELSRDQISVIFIKHEDDNQKVRKIFNKINRYAKQTSRGDNIITSQDDTIAIIARRLLGNGAPLAGNLVNWKSNTLAAGSSQFTTISAVYDTVETLLGDELARKEIDKHKKPSEADLDQYFMKVAKIWQEVLDNVDEYQNVLNDSDQVKQRRKVSLLFKPAMQMALFNGLKKALDAGTNLEDAIARLNDIQWTINAPMWRHVMVGPNGNIDAGKTAKELAARLIAQYLSRGGVQDPDLLTDYRNRIDDQTAALPIPPRIPTTV